MNKPRTIRIAIWIVAEFLAAHLVITAHQHHMPTLDTAVIGLVSLYAFSTGALHLADRRNTSRNEAR